MCTQLLFLPFELLLLIVQYLDWTDILRLRQTCKVLSEATRERAVVQNLVVRYCTMFPATAFSLDRPISMHTTEQLEHIIRRNEAAHRGWDINAPHLNAPFVPKKREIHLNYVAKTFCLIEGGRWLLVVRITGSVDYYDLEDEGSVSKTLIPDLAQRRPWTMVLVATDRDYNEPVLTFNMAIYTRTWLGFVAEQLQVWRITLELDDNHSGVGLVASHVVTLSLGTEYTPSDISLCGKYIAWDYVERVDNVCLNVVNWMDVAISNQAKINSTYGSTPVKTTIGKKVVHPAPEMVSPSSSGRNKR
ncbi:hypothetical protein CPC08DRAFT_528305 [Agrocybe pediades]|nr:hypothetical protein CPC08DRAFT_528305 [Agrocybe pediades]